MTFSSKKIISGAVVLAATSVVLFCAADVARINSELAAPGAMWTGGTDKVPLVRDSYANSIAKASAADDPAAEFEWLLPSGDTIYLEAADTPAKEELGLGGRASLARNQGMLFVFPAPGDYGFWMKGMRFPIDIIWLDSGFKVAHIEKGLSPDSYPKIFDPHARASYVVEVNAGIAEELSLSAGDTLLVYQK